MSGHGLVVGKFYPPHAGHHFLIDTALSRCDRVTVVVLAASVESVPAEMRHAWLAERHPRARIRSGIDDHPVDYGDAAVYDLHDRVIRRLCPEPIDVVFSSEPYGPVLASRYGAEHVMVDRDRCRHPVSGSDVRADPSRHWQHLSPPVRAWLTKRVAIVGAESTGTTTIAQSLARDWATTWVPEHGRAYSSEKLSRGESAWRSDEFDEIARVQLSAEDEAARGAGPVMFCDTDALATAIWHERYLGSPSPSVRAIADSRRYALYLLTDCDIPFVDDGLRDGAHIRPWMTQRFKAELERRPEPTVVLSGTHEQRLATATDAVARVLEGGWNFAAPLG